MDATTILKNSDIESVDLEDGDSTITLKINQHATKPSREVDPRLDSAIIARLTEDEKIL